MKIAAVQLESMHGKIAENLAQHEKYIIEAIATGAEMVVFPELSVSGYIPNYSLWETIREPHIDIVQWMKEISKKYKIFLGVGLCEYIHNDMRNTYVITGPEGKIEGRAEKNHAESYVFAMGNGVHVIPINGKKVGVCICADAHITDCIKTMQREHISLLLMPHAWPTPYKTGYVVKEEDVINQNKELKALPKMIAQLVHAPVVCINQIGTMDTMLGIFGKFMTPKTFRLQGHSSIIDAKGTVLSEIDDTAGIIYATIDSKEQVLTDYPPVPDYNGWIHKGSTFIRQVLAPIDIFLGQKLYRKKLAKFIEDNHLPSNTK